MKQAWFWFCNTVVFELVNNMNMKRATSMQYSMASIDEKIKKNDFVQKL